MRSRELAEQLADLLHDADGGCFPRQQETDATLAQYVCVEQVPGVFRLFRTHGLLLGDPIGRSSDGGLCRRSALLLNRVDPGKKIRVETGIRWW